MLIEVACHKMFISLGISFLWYSAIGSLLTVVIGLIVSAITNKIAGVYPSVESDLLVPVSEYICLCLPQYYKDKLLHVSENGSTKKVTQDTLTSSCVPLVETTSNRNPRAGKNEKLDPK